MTFISIHAPLAGGDPGAGKGKRGPKHFNPRPPCGGRQVPNECDWNVIHFNPRPPCGGRPGDCIVKPYTDRFQSTPPLRGATLIDGDRDLAKRISIHAPLAGGDGRCGTGCAWRRRFQSTPPLRGATPAGTQLRIVLPISIHAPLAGGDKRG